MTQIYYCRLFTLWHVDPCKIGFGGSDDTCGWFKRALHGDKAVLDRIVKRFEEDWDRTFQSKKEDHDDEDGPYRGTLYFSGLFCPNGDPHFSVHGIVLNLFFVAINEHFKTDGRTNWKKARRWMQANLFDIMFFAENPVDSLFDGLTRKFEIGCGENHTPERRQERIQRMAECIYGWILREEQRWWQHPRWHIHHWKLNIHFTARLKRWLFSRCCKCGQRFAYGESPVTNNWNSRGPRWFSGETDIYHGNCSGKNAVERSGCGQA